MKMLNVTIKAENNTKENIKQLTHIACGTNSSLKRGMDIDFYSQTKVRYAEVTYMEIMKNSWYNTL